MATEVGSIYVDVDANTRGFEQGMKRVSGGMKTMAKAAGIGAAAIGTGFVYALKRGFDELSESQKVMAQTEAALKSTGEVANVTAKDVEGLASSLSAMTGIDDEAIQANENLLLTFKNVRNEVGKGNDIFKQATQASLDLSTAGFGSLESTAKMLGKALNDPVKGMTAMGRAGVTFSEGQKKAIEAMTKSGDLLGAQKLILQEVESQVGGSAKAYGETLPGQLAKARNAFDEIAGKVAERFLPALTSALDWVNSNWPQIEKVMNGVATVIISSFEMVASAVRTAAEVVNENREAFMIGAAIAAGIVVATAAYEGFRAAMALATAAQVAFNIVAAANPYVLIAAAIIGVVAALAALYMSNERVRNAVNRAWGEIRSFVMPIIGGLRAAWDRFGADIVSIANTAFGMVVSAVRTFAQNVLSPFKILIAVLNGEWGKAWGEIKATVSRNLDNVKTLLSGAVSIFLTLATRLGEAIIDGIVAGLSALAAKVSQAMSPLLKTLVMFPIVVAQKAVEIGRAIVSGIVAGLGGIASAIYGIVKKAIQDAFGWLGSFLGIGSPSKKAADEIGRPISEGVAKGVKDGAAAKAAELQAAGRRIVANLAAGVASQFPMLASISKQIAATLGSSFDSPEAVAQAKAGAAKIFNALKANAPLIASAGKILGSGAVREIINGVIGVTPSLVQQLKTALGSAVQTAMEEAKRKVQEARAGLSAAFADAASAALAAFDAATAAWQPPSLLKAQREAEEREAAQLQKTITDAQTAIQTSMGVALAASNQLAALGTAPPPGMDPEEWQKKVDEAKAVIAQAGEDIKAAQATLDDALFQQRQAMLRKQGEEEQKAHDEKRERQRVAFENDLIALERWAQENWRKHKRLGQRLKELWEEYGIKGQQWGKTFGEKLAQGLRDAKAEVRAASKELAQVIADNTLPGSPTKAGPLSKFDMRDAGYDLMALYSEGIEAASSSLVSNALAGVGGGRGGYPAAGGGGSSVVNVYVSGSVLSERDLVDAVRQGLIREGRRTGPNLLGGYA